MHKIIFLDIDGVLCPYPPWQTTWVSNQNSMLSPVCCENLKKLLDETDARIVLTTSWRLFKKNLEDLFIQLAQNDIPYGYIVDQTPDLKSDPSIQSSAELRYLEISEYVIRNNVERYLILDDFDLSAYDNEHFVHTHKYRGLTEHQISGCIKILKKI